MFRKWKVSMEDIDNDNFRDDDIEENIRQIREANSSGNVNSILKGSRLKGDINITCDLELSGDVEGNITSDNNSNIVIKGTCKGNIKTREGDVTISGEMYSGNIMAGNNVSVSGKFNGGEIKAKGKIYINGEFSGRIEGKEIELGADASGKGEFFYEDLISISRGARVSGQITQTQKEIRLLKEHDKQKISVQMS